MRKGRTVHTDNSLLEPFGPPQRRDEQPRTEKRRDGRSTVYRKIPQASIRDFSDHPESILTDEDVIRFLKSRH